MSFYSFARAKTDIPMQAILSFSVEYKSRVFTNAKSIWEWPRKPKTHVRFLSCIRYSRAYCGEAFCHVRFHRENLSFFEILYMTLVFPDRTKVRGSSLSRETQIEEEEEAGNNIYVIIG